MWDIKYRPVRFSDVLGQESTAQILKLRLTKGTAFDTSYIFSGGHGQGKTTLARILARSMLCTDLQSDGEPCNVCDMCKEVLADANPAFTETDAASNGTIDHIRKIVSDLPFAIKGADKRIYLFDEMHRMGPASQDVLLKPIEDKKLVGIFCTTEAVKIRGTIRSRCEEYKIRNITREDILGRMRLILTQEQIEFEEDAVLTVIDHSHGHVRDVVNKLEMIAQLGPIRLEAVREYLSLSVVSMYYEILLSLGNPAVAVKLAETACDQVGPDAVYEGLAEAAMTSYRMANRMYVDYTYVDRILADKVQAQYKDALLQLTEHFVAAPPKAGRIRLLCDILACSTGVPSKAVVTKVQVQVAAPIILDSPPVPVLNPPQLAVAVLADLIKPPSIPSTERTSKVGNLGSDDACALTSLDEKAIRQDMPRGTSESVRPSKDVPKGKADLLTHDEWSRAIYQRMDIFGMGV